MHKRHLLTTSLVSAILVFAASAGTYLLAAPGDAQAPKAKKAKAAKAPKAPTTGQGQDEEQQTPYKPIAKEFIANIAKGKADVAIKGANDYLAEAPGDLESLYCLAVAYAKLKQPDKAMEYVRQAVAGGLPFGRFYAGPRNLLAPLTETKAFRDFAAGHPVDPIHGPVLGSMTDTSVRVWVRTAAETPVQVLVSTNADMSGAVKSPVVSTKASVDFTAVVELAGLKGDTTYHYQVLVDGKPVKIDPAPTFHTFPAPGAKSKFEVVFGGGAEYIPQHERMWDTLG